jgi:preprotein translocase subunit SecF
MLNFIKLRYLYFLISGLVIIPGLISLALFGLQPSIDFTGGSLLELQLQNTEAVDRFTLDEVKNNVQAIFEVTAVQSSGENRFIVRGKQISNDQKDMALRNFETVFGELRELRFETLGPSLGSELITKTLIALGLATLVIMLYISRQFDQLKFGVSAILAIIHDLVVLLGVFSLLGYFYGVEVDILFVTALLTTLSFSVHDTVVVYDRIRETLKKFPRLGFENVLNLSILETLGRSLNNSITIILMLLALALLGGESIRWFSVALLIGAVTGTYSSTFVAVPLLMVWQDLESKLKARRGRR